MSDLGNAFTKIADSFAVMAGGYTAKEQKRYDQLLKIYDDEGFCKSVVRIESKIRRISWNEITAFNAKLQEMEL
ncbi:hypothetical protein QN289_03550 [Latilactobacillus curvatus]|uniref:hypothetical protein n=1 Tax=Latilactobacillus curvatus TaxID=28038 RepID=UPI0024DF7E17|nr:hypothetical protein [Latilactobacillus curvatus]WIE01444.1 hypothetical protein QN289_03550 [Latilactobacillus curvatus]